MRPLLLGEQTGSDLACDRVAPVLAHPDSGQSPLPVARMHGHNFVGAPRPTGPTYDSTPVHIRRLFTNAPSRTQTVAFGAKLFPGSESTTVTLTAGIGSSVQSCGPKGPTHPPRPMSSTTRLSCGMLSPLRK